MADPQQRAKQYERIHNALYVTEAVLGFLLLSVFLTSGASAKLADVCRDVSRNPWIHVTLYAIGIVCALKILYFPLDYYGGYRLEHRFGLSNESMRGWLLDEVKSFGINLSLGIIVLNGLYLLLRQTGSDWWIWAGAAFMLFGVVLSALIPVLILPWFYKLEPLENEALLQRLTALSERAGARVLGIYRMALSEKTKKANAAFAGLGRTKRILLGDTLLETFTEDEIEIVMAHEIAHYRHADLWWLIAWGGATTLLGLRIADFGLQAGMKWFGFVQASDPGAFPLLAFCLLGFGLFMLPLRNSFARWRERKADRAALELTGNRDAFLRAMRKLGEQNLADFSPHPVVEFLWHDHPSLARRMAEAERWNGN